MLFLSKRASLSARVLLIVFSATVFATSFFSYQNSLGKIAVATVPSTVTSQNDLQTEGVALGLRIKGLDQHGKEFSITASKGTHRENYVEMEDLRIEIYLYGDKQTKINAKHGTAHIDQKKIRLDQSIKVELPDGTLILAEQILLDYGNESLLSERPISINSGTTRMTADSFKMIYKGNKRSIILQGNAQGHFNEKSNAKK